MSLISVTCKDRKEAQRIADALLTERLVACANFFPISSLYLWKGKKEKAREYLLLLKTTRKKSAQAVQRIRRLHSYGCPVIEVLQTKANKEAEQWLRKELE